MGLPGLTVTPDPTEARLARLKRRAGLALLWEDAWPPLSWASAVVLLFLAVSWFGLWYETPRLARFIGLVAFGLALLFALAPLVRLSWPAKGRVLARLDLDSTDQNEPASGLSDRLANAGGDETTRALWAMHRARLAQRLESVEVEPPSPGMARRDPRAFRFAAILLALVGAFAAGSERYARVAAAFDAITPAAPAVAPRVDAWIDPPAYTGKPPILLKAVGQVAPETISAPEDSALIVRSTPGAVAIEATGGLASVEAKASASDQKTLEEHRFVLHGDGEARLRQGASTLATFTFHVTPKGHPTIALIDPPQPNLSGSLTLHYSVADVYGSANAEANFAQPSGGLPAPRSLVGPPKLQLALPNAANGVGDARTTSDLAEHPWAGAQVTMTLKATNVAGQTGESAPITMTLPQRNFVNPLARALVEQRRDLILDPDHNRPHVAKALDALAIAPDAFDVKPNAYLGLHEGQLLLAAAVGDKALLGVADWLWTVALQIEDGDASQALRDLRAAEQKLRDALKRGASEQELKKLAQEMRDAAERYFAEMAQNADRDAANEEPQPDSRDLDAMLDKLDEAARTGSRDEAQAMLDELQNMMENMRSAKEAQSSPAQKQMRQQMRDLDKLLKDQQALRDDTFRRDQRERSGAEPPKDGDDGQSLDKRQQSLAERLKELQKQLEQLGAPHEKKFGEAQADMTEAQGDLQGDQPGEGAKPGQGSKPGDGDEPGGNGSGRKPGHTGKGDAVDAQGRALQALREGAQSMQQQMQGGGKGQRGYTAMPGNGRPSGKDPLGRGQNGARGTSEGRLSGGADSAERARRVLQELRRRLADPNRPTDERDYLERLLDRP